MSLQHRGMLIHVSHIDPVWIQHKETEKPFDLATALQLLPLMAANGMNTLIVDVEDGVCYQSHPEMARHYSVPIEQLRTLSDEARRLGLDVVPKLNWSKSGRNLHDMWMKPHWDHVSWLDNMDEYYAVAKDVIGELTQVMRPGRFFHIGMDEDHYRSHSQYVDTIETLRAMVVGLGLRAIVWNDSCHYQKTKLAMVHADKCRSAEEHLSKDIVHILWDYERWHPEIIQRVAERGFEVWGAPGGTPDQVAGWRQALEQNGGNGLIMTHWTKCEAANKQALVDLLNRTGSGYR